MATDIQGKIDELKTLSVSDRLHVVEAVWDSIDDETPMNLSSEQRKELDRRLDALEANPDDSLTWDQMLERMRGKL